MTHISMLGHLLLHELVFTAGEGFAIRGSGSHDVDEAEHLGSYLYISCCAVITAFASPKALQYSFTFSCMKGEREQ